MKFVKGILDKISEDYYNLTLFDKSDKVVYTSTIPTHEACRLILKHNNIILSK